MTFSPSSVVLIRRRTFTLHQKAGEIHAPSLTLAYTHTLAQTVQPTQSLHLRCFGCRFAVVVAAAALQLPSHPLCLCIKMCVCERGACE